MPEERKKKVCPPLPDFFFWQPKGCCPSLRLWHPANRAELARYRVLKYAELDPGDGYRGYVAELRGAEVVGDIKLVVTAEDVVLGDLQFLQGATNPERH
jgi:hypothetical protein